MCVSSSASRGMTDVCKVSFTFAFSITDAEMVVNDNNIVGSCDMSIKY